MTDTEEWKDLASTCLLEFARTVPEFTSDTALERVEAEVGKAPHTNQKGALFRSVLVKPGHVVKVGHTKSDKPSAHGREIPVWKSTLVSSDTELEPLQKMYATYRSMVHLKTLKMEDAFRKCYEAGAQGGTQCE